jgi:hypothetical protein
VITIGGRTACSCCGRWDTLVSTWRADLRDWVIGEMKRGSSMGAIADMLNRAHVPPLGGGEGWRASSVQSLHRSPTNGRLGVRT